MPITYTAAYDARLWLLGVLRVDLGSASLRMAGAIEAGPGALRLVASAAGPPIAAPLLPPPPPPVEAPLGMTGVRVRDFGADLTVSRRTDGSARVDGTLGADAEFTAASLSRFRLQAAVAVDDGAARLVFARLTATPALTLADFARAVVGGSWDWADGVADRFAFQSGAVYAVRAPAGAAPGYTFPYPLDGTTVVPLAPGYGVRATLLVLGVPFAVAVTVTQGPSGAWVRLTTTALTPIDFDFVTFRDPSLEIATEPGNAYLRVSTSLSILSTDIDATVQATYVPARRLFTGRVTATLGFLSLPTVGGSESRPVTLGVTFEWSPGGFRLVAIDGLPALPADFADRFLSILNSVRSGGCQQLLSEWMDGLVSTSLKPGLNGAPTRDGGTMVVPLKVTWTASVAGASFSNDLPFTARFTIPESLADLPRAIALSVVQSAGSIAADMLSNPDFYVALSAEAARRYGARAAARYLCRALENFGKEVAQRLADLVANTVADTLAGAAELAAALTSVALAGLGGVVSGFLSLLEDIWDWLTGKDDDKEREAEDQLRAQMARIDQAMQVVNRKVDEARAQLAVASLSVRVDDQGRFAAGWTMRQFSADRIGEGAQVNFRLRLMTGEAGDTAGQPWPGQPPVVLPLGTPQWAIPFEQIPDAQRYRLNATVDAGLTGIVFLTDDTRRELQDAIDQLRGADNGVASQAADDLQRKLNDLIALNTTGIRSAPVWASLGMPALATVGQSRVGINTRVG